jgi:proteasome lid subunit RPN8/RPN11
MDMTRRHWPGEAPDWPAPLADFAARHRGGATEALFVLHACPAMTARHVSVFVAPGAYSVQAPVRTMVWDSLRHDAERLLIAHTHPSGDARPSKSDIDLTRHLARIYRAIGVRIVDHVILTRDAHFSFREEGLL